MPTPDGSGNAEMPDLPDECAERPAGRGPHPGLAIVAFFAAFLFAALPFGFDSDDFFVVAPCLIACFSSSILFIRVMVGDLRRFTYIFLAAAGHLCYAAGEQWYVVVLLALGTLLCSFLMARLIGDFAPVIRDVKS